MCDHTFNASEAVFEDAQQALAWAERHVAREIDDLVDKALDQLPGADAFTGVAGDNDAPRASAALPADVAPPVDDVAAVGEPQRDTQSPDTEPGPPLDRAWRFHADADFYAQPQPVEYSYGRQADSGAAGGDPPAALFVDEFDSTMTKTHWGATAAALFLALLLLGQYAFVERHWLASKQRLRPALEVFCDMLRCDLPLRRDLGKMEMVEREVRDHPNVADALLINAAFVNRAAFAQAWPLFQISFSDVSGTLVALRRFRPEEYLDAGRDPSAGMAPGEEARLLLEVIDPGDSAVSFQFDFL
ncbi:MAG: DUF3426 domain-containing protein [Thiogranum sp.]|nr:DUF3426 domain-containing protein [Thiogranum sp.]